MVRRASAWTPANQESYRDQNGSDDQQPLQRTNDETQNHQQQGRGEKHHDELHIPSVAARFTAPNLTGEETDDSQLHKRGRPSDPVTRPDPG